MGLSTEVKDRKNRTADALYSNKASRSFLEHVGHTGRFLPNGKSFGRCRSSSHSLFVVDQSAYTAAWNAASVVGAKAIGTVLLAEMVTGEKDDEWPVALIRSPTTTACKPTGTPE